MGERGRGKKKQLLKLSRGRKAIKYPKYLRKGGRPSLDNNEKRIVKKLGT